MADPITYDDFAKVELRVARVLEARPHPNADKLMLLQVSLGEETKQIVAGIRLHYTPEQLVGKNIVIVNNLAPAMLRGEASNGMLLAATSGEKVVLLDARRPRMRPRGEDQVSRSRAGARAPREDRVGGQPGGDDRQAGERLERALVEHAPQQQERRRRVEQGGDRVAPGPVGPGQVGPASPGGRRRWRSPGM